VCLEKYQISIAHSNNILQTQTQLNYFGEISLNELMQGYFPYGTYIHT